MCTSQLPLPCSHQFGDGRGRHVSQRGGAVGLRGRCLRGPQLAGRRLVLHGPLREAAFGERLPANLPQLRASGDVPLVQHRASVVPDLKTVTDPQPRGTGGCNHVLPVWTPSEMCGVWSLRLGHLRKHGYRHRDPVQSSALMFIQAPFIRSCDWLIVDVRTN